MGGVGDELLDAVDDVVVAVSNSAGTHAEDVGAAFGFRHCHARDEGAVDDLRQESVALLFVA